MLQLAELLYCAGINMYCQCQVSFQEGVSLCVSVCVWGGGGGGTLVFYINVGYAYFVGSEFQYFLCFQKNEYIYSFGRGGGGEGWGGYGSFLHTTQIILCGVVDKPLTILTQ